MSQRHHISDGESHTAQSHAHGEPPCRYAEAEGELRRAHCRLSAHQSADDSAGDDPCAGLASAGMEVVGVLHLTHRKDADNLDESHRQNQT